MSSNSNYYLAAPKWCKTSTGRGGRAEETKASKVWYAESTELPGHDRLMRGAGSSPMRPTASAYSPEARGARRISVSKRAMGETETDSR